MLSETDQGHGVSGGFGPWQSPEAGFVTALRTSARVWHALMLRETRARFGRNALGFLWALIEPAVFIVLFLAIRVVALERYPAFGENAILFFASGIIAYRYYAAIAGRTLTAITSNHALLTYPVVRPADVIIARALLETVTMLIVTLLFWGMLSLIEEQRIIHHPATFALGLAAMTFLAWGVGTFNAVFARLLPAWERIHPLLGLPLLIASGIFYLPVTMPENIKIVLFWNPILHCIEWIRIGIYLDYLPLLNRPYPIAFGAIALVLGLSLERMFRRIILRR
jgi:capsular polysaccharide transport system permease protein